MDWIRQIGRSWRSKNKTASHPRQVELPSIESEHSSHIELGGQYFSGNLSEYSNPVSNGEATPLLIAACLTGNSSIIDELLRDKPILSEMSNERDSHNRTFLHALALSRSVESVNIATRLILAEKDAPTSIPALSTTNLSSRAPLPIHVVDDHGETPLSLILRCDNEPLLSTLLTGGLSPSQSISVLATHLRGDSYTSDYFSHDLSDTAALDETRGQNVHEVVTSDEQPTLHGPQRGNAEYYSERRRVTVSLLYACCVFNAPACLRRLLSSGASPNALLLANTPRSITTTTIGDKQNGQGSTGTRRTRCRHWRGLQLLRSLRSPGSQTEVLNRINDEVARGNDDDDTRDEREETEAVVSAQSVESEADIPAKAAPNEAEEEEKRHEDDDDNTGDVCTLYCSQCDEDPPHLALISAKEADFAIYNTHIPEGVAADVASAEPQTGTLLDDISSAEGPDICLATRFTVLLESGAGACVRLGRVQCLALLIAAGVDIKLPDLHGRSPLYLAALSGNTALIPLLLLAPSVRRANDGHSERDSEWDSELGGSSVKQTRVCGESDGECGADACVRQVYRPCPSPEVISALLASHPVLADTLTSTSHRRNSNRATFPGNSDFPGCDYSGLRSAPWGSGLLSQIIIGAGAANDSTNKIVASGSSGRGLRSHGGPAAAMGGSTRELSVLCSDHALSSSNSSPRNTGLASACDASSLSVTQLALSETRRVLATPIAVAKLDMVSYSAASASSTASSSSTAFSSSAASSSFTASTLVAEMLLCKTASGAMEWLLRRWPLLRITANEARTRALMQDRTNQDSIEVIRRGSDRFALCQCSCDIMSTDGVGATVLHRAAVSLQPAIVQTLQTALNAAMTPGDTATPHSWVTSAPDATNQQLVDPQCLVDPRCLVDRQRLALHSDCMGFTALQWARALGCRGEVLALLRRAEQAPRETEVIPGKQ